MSAFARKHFNIHEAKTNLSSLLRRVERGEEVVISRAGKPIATIVPLPVRANRRGFGMFEEEISVAEDWDTYATNVDIAEEFDR